MSVKTWGAALTVVLAMAIGVQAETHLVTLAGVSFTPDSISIRVGDVVRWEVISGSHTTTSGTGAADPAAGTLWDEVLSGSGASYEHTFNGPGVYPYFCRPHEGSGMKGVIVVIAAAPATSTVAQVGLVVLLLLFGAFILWRRRRLAGSANI